MSEVFLDTSIQVARFVHSPESKQRIESRLKNYDIVLSGLIVKQEFKRRLLKEAQYLLGLVMKYGSYEKVLRHVVDVLPQQQGRKRNICLEMVNTVFEGESDEDMTDRLKQFLRSLLLDGLDDFHSKLSGMVEDSNCGCARIPVREIREFEKYEFGTDKCKQATECGVRDFLSTHEELLRRILAVLKDLPQESKTSEIANAERFVEEFLKRQDAVRDSNPCLTVGDLLIALESAGISSFFTMNGKESQYFCKLLGQNLVVRPRNHENADILCLAGEDWPKF